MKPLRSYQRDAVEKMKTGCILCGGVGSGKSKTALAYYFKLCGGDPDSGRPMQDPMDIFVITTARKRDTLEWDAELADFSLSTDKKSNGYGNVVKVDSWNNIGKYVGVEGAFFIFDEQRVIGSGAWVRAFLTIAKSNEWILLSATPGDCWMDYIPVFIANGFYRNRSDFIRQHVIYKPFTNFAMVDRYVGTGKLLRLKNDILVPMDFKRQTVSHVEDIFVGYDAAKCHEVSRSRYDPFKDQPIANAADYCYCIRRIVNSDEQRQTALLEILEDHESAIIFYNYNYELDILRSLGYREGTVVAEWNGKKHEPVPKENRFIYLVQYAAGAEGWNCVRTDTMIFYSLNYSYKVMEQAKGRIDRMNTPFTDLYYYRLRSRSGIDLAISRALKEKKKFNENVFFEGV